MSHSQGIRTSKDNDYGLILSLHENDPEGVVMSGEVTGLPGRKGHEKSYDVLAATRQRFEADFMGLPLDQAEDSPRHGLLVQPIPVEVEGALFFSPPRAPRPGARPGSPFEATTGWQIHPVTAIRRLNTPAG